MQRHKPELVPLHPRSPRGSGRKHLLGRNQPVTIAVIGDSAVGNRRLTGSKLLGDKDLAAVGCAIPRAVDIADGAILNNYSTAIRIEENAISAAAAEGTAVDRDSTVILRQHRMARKFHR